MKIGDKVRFLNENGGGRISGFQDGGIVLVEDEDGFDIPMRRTDIVVIGAEDYSTGNMAKAAIKAKQPKPSSEGKSVKALMAEQDDEDEEEESDPSEREISFKAPAEERKGGDTLNAYIAYVPIDVKDISNTRFECFLVNDSNYYMSFAYATAENSAWTLRQAGVAEPNTKVFIEEFGREDLNGMGRISVQLIAYKQDKSYIAKPAVAMEARVDAVKFYKLHTFRESIFFEQPALLYPIVENDKPARTLVVNAEQLKQEMYKSAEEPKPAQPKKRKEHEDTIITDLHAQELLETTAGMSNSDILNYQLDIFRKTLDKYKNRKGQKLIFIHGKGEGVLRQALIHDLKYRYKSYTYQDASFREYGYGATLITIK